MLRGPTAATEPVRHVGRIGQASEAQAPAVTLAANSSAASTTSSLS